MATADSIGMDPVNPNGPTARPEGDAPSPKRRHPRAILEPPSLSGLTVALVFLAASLVPALLPRPWFVQGTLSGVAIALGYGAGSSIAKLWHLAVGRAVEHHPPRWGRTFVVVASGGLVIWALILNFRWQVDIRGLMNMDPGAWGYLIVATLLALLVGFVLIILARTALTLLRRFLRLLERVIPRPWSILSIVLVGVMATVLFFDLVVASRLIPALEAAHRSSDRSFDPGVSPPQSTMRSGGPDSFIEWDRMGRQGRVFVTEAPSPDDLETFTAEPALDPIRIYVGLEVADTAEARARLALAEMERTGAFQREVIVLIAPTGSGWIDPYAVEPVEYMYNGDTASVAVQYSYLASWMVMLRNQDLATEASRALYRAVSSRLMEEPESTRPRLVLYGESLGSFGWERAFTELDEVIAGSDGALWVGPPRVNPLWSRLMSQREPDSPVWRPVYDGGETVRFGPDLQSLLAPGPRWVEPRIVYLQHASDPITWLSLDVLWNKPPWLEPPRGPDVSSLMPYLPGVTYFQMAIDLAVGTNAPVGHGHKFGPAQAEAWSLIIPPPGWDADDTEALVTIVSGSE